MQVFKRTLSRQKQQGTDKPIKPALSRESQSLPIRSRARPAESGGGACQCRQTKTDHHYNIVPIPKQLPTLASGQVIYAENCAQCRSGWVTAESRHDEPKNPSPPTHRCNSWRAPFKAFNAVNNGFFCRSLEEERWRLLCFSLR
jgi:hypothetical protein